MSSYFRLKSSRPAGGESHRSKQRRDRRFRAAAGARLPETARLPGNPGGRVLSYRFRRHCRKAAAGSEALIASSSLPSAAGPCCPPPPFAKKPSRKRVTAPFQAARLCARAIDDGGHARTEQSNEFSPAPVKQLIYTFAPSMTADMSRPEQSPLLQSGTEPCQRALGTHVPMADEPVALNGASVYLRRLNNVCLHAVCTLL